MEWIFKLLFLCTLVSFTNLLGMYPAKDDMIEWLKTQGTIIRTIVYSYVFIVVVGLPLTYLVYE